MRKSCRVKKEAECQTVITRGQSCANRQFEVYMLEKPDQKHFRAGRTVGKQIGNAVARNLVKRRIRQSLTEWKPQLKQDCDFLVIARPTVAYMSMAEVKEHLKHVLKLAKVLGE